MAIRIATKTGMSISKKLLAAAVLRGMTNVPILPKSMRARTGASTVPNAPIGSRKNIFNSSQTSFHSPRIIYLIPDGVAGHLDEHILEVRHDRAEFADTESIL